MATGTTRRWLMGFSGCAGLAAAAWIFAGGPGCVEQGATDNQEQVGRQERGRDPGSYDTEVLWDAQQGKYVWLYDLAYTDVILSPDGAALLAMAPLPGPDAGYDEPGLVLVAQLLPAGEMRVFPELRDLERINFSPDGTTAYLIRNGGDALVVLDLTSLAIEKTIPLDSAFGVVDVSADGRFLVLSNLPTSDGQELFYEASNCNPGYSASLGPDASACRVGFIDLESGDQWAVQTPLAVRDIDLSPVDGDVLFTYSTWAGGTPLATVEFYSPVQKKVLSKASFQNCADELVIAEDKLLGILSPTQCSRDPISIIDLEKRSFVKTLPGFGPVVLARDGTTAIGFTRRQEMEQQWGYHDQDTKVGLIVVNLNTLEWTVMEHGDVEPAYTVSPDGKSLYLYHETLESEMDDEGHLHYYHQMSDMEMVDLTDFSTHPIAASGLGLERFVWTGDGKEMFFLSGSKLFRLKAGAAQADQVPLPVSPELINIRPQGDFLVLGEADAPIFYLHWMAADHPLATLSLSVSAR